MASINDKNESDDMIDNDTQKQLSKHLEMALITETTKSLTTAAETTDLNDEEMKEKSTKNIGDLRRSKTLIFSEGHKIPCWMSIDIHLLDIVLHSENFCINAWMTLFFKDTHETFESLFQDKELESIKKNGFIKYDDLSVDIRKKLPLKRSFLLNATDMNIETCYLEYYEPENRIWKLYFRFGASCSEHFELSNFPFDSQFLNMQIVYRISDYYFLSECPDWIMDDPEKKYKAFRSNEPVKVSVKESIKTQWQVLQPWMDFRADRGKEYEFHFSVIRLRATRDPQFYLVNGVLPLFLVVTCSFASFVMSIETDLGNKLSYIITLLLTTAALQYALSSDLPKTPETTMIDAYILYAYGTLSFFILEIAMIALIYDAGYEDQAEKLDFITVALFAFVWFYKSFKFLFLYWKYKHGLTVDWDKLSDDEMRGWCDSMKGDSKYMVVEPGKCKGTKDK